MPDAAGDRELREKAAGSHPRSGRRLTRALIPALVVAVRLDR